VFASSQLAAGKLPPTPRATSRCEAVLPGIKCFALRVTFKLGRLADRFTRVAQAPDSNAWKLRFSATFQVAMNSGADIHKGLSSEREFASLDPVDFSCSQSQLRSPTMNRIVLPVVFLALISLANLAEACGRCGRAACRQPATCVYAAPVCATPTFTTRYVKRYVTCYKTVSTVRPVTTMKRVTYRDECGVCRVKCCPETRYVRCVQRVPYTVCRTVAIRTPCYTPMVRPVAVSYCPPARRSCLSGCGLLHGGLGLHGCGLLGGRCSTLGCW